MLDLIEGRSGCMVRFGRIATAMVTPFDRKGHIDFPKTTQLVNYLIANGTESLVVAGTTGESPTLSKEEKLALIDHVVKVVIKVFLLLQEQEATILMNQLNYKKGRTTWCRCDYACCSVL